MSICLFVSSCGQSNGLSGVRPEDAPRIPIAALNGYSWTLDMALGETTTYPMLVENIGMGSETFVISTTSSLGWIQPEMPLPDTITFNKGDSVTFPLRVTVPLTATPDMEDSFLFTFLRQADSFIDETATLTIRIKPKE